MTLVLVKFDLSQIDAKAIVSYPTSRSCTNQPIYEAVFCIGKHKAAEVSRRQFSRAEATSGAALLDKGTPEPTDL